jgi:hypothetical protein
MEEVKNGWGGKRANTGGKREGSGRPFKEVKADKQIRLSCYEWQHTALKDKAKQAGLSLSAYLIKKGLED